jgi:DNA mismatch endonuclease (patch repair protein)
VGRHVRDRVTPYPSPTSTAVTAVMKANRKRDTRSEVRLRSELQRSGLRFRKSWLITAGPVRVRADAAFPAARVAVFSDGCFWHACPDHGTHPRRNQEYWTRKLVRNVERDRRVDDALRTAGWKVVRVWEHENPMEAASRIAREVRPTPA